MKKLRKWHKHNISVINRKVANVLLLQGRDVLISEKEHIDELERGGFNVFVAHSTIEADNIVASVNIDTIVTTLNMSHDYLPPDFTKYTHGGTFTPWIWWLLMLITGKIQVKGIVIASDFLSELEESFTQVPIEGVPQVEIYRICRTILADSNMFKFLYSMVNPSELLEKVIEVGSQGFKSGEICNHQILRTDYLKLSER